MAEYVHVHDTRYGPKVVTDWNHAQHNVKIGSNSSNETIINSVAIVFFNSNAFCVGSNRSHHSFQVFRVQ